MESAGPTMAAAILAVATWHWLFLINVPLGVFALIVAARTLPDTPRSARRLDGWSVLLNALTFGLLIIGIDSHFWVRCSRVEQWVPATLP